ncbi:MAG: hypothetical protein ABEH43_11540 [Flavobacteriales bacterium]
MDLSKEETYHLTGLSKINVLLGKNGSGKSSLLKKIGEEAERREDCFGNYVTPERGGVLENHAGLEQDLRRNERDIYRQKRANQWTDSEY